MLQPKTSKGAQRTRIALRPCTRPAASTCPWKKLRFAPTRPPEELSRWRDDPWQLENLAADPAHAESLAALRGRLDRWMAEMGDDAPEPEALGDSDMKVYLGKVTRSRPTAVSTDSMLSASDRARPPARGRAGSPAARGRRGRC